MRLRRHRRLTSPWAMKKAQQATQQSHNKRSATSAAPSNSKPLTSCTPLHHLKYICPFLSAANSFPFFFPTNIFNETPVTFGLLFLERASGVNNKRRNSKKDWIIGKNRRRGKHRNEVRRAHLPFPACPGPRKGDGSAPGPSTNRVPAPGPAW